MICYMHTLVTKFLLPPYRKLMQLYLNYVNSHKRLSTVVNSMRQSASRGRFYGGLNGSVAPKWL